ncbi:MAG: serine/threonine-protein kinase [Acidimicrobiales bacterium]
MRAALPGYVDGMVEQSSRVAPPSIPGVEELEPVGRGGFAVVYRGWQPEYQRHVAVKVLEPTTDPAVVGRFRREVRAMGAVSDHPNVVPIYGAGVVDGRGYMVMPLLAGGTLDDKIRSAPLDAPEVVRIGRALADALAASHRIGLLHRDVKPANVLFTAYGDPQLADFGIARFADSTATHTGFAATVAYAAPEVLQGEPATPQSDVYSLGATLHAALRGEAPFRRVDGEPAVVTAMRVLSDEPAHLKAAGVPAALAAVVERAMAKDPAHRYPTAHALRHALETVDLRTATRKRPTASATAIETEHLTRVRTEVVGVGGPAAAATSIAKEPIPGSPQTVGAWRRRAPLIVCAAVAAAILLTALALTQLRNGHNDTTTAPSGTESSGTTTSVTTTGPATAVTVLASTAPATTALSTSTVAAAPTATATRPTTTASVRATPDSATRSYYALMDAGRIDEGWSLLSPAYQQQTVRSSYEGFWRTIDRVEVLSARAEGRTAWATLRYTRTNGTVSTENVRLDFVPDATGRLLVNAYQTGVSAP